MLSSRPSNNLRPYGSRTHEIVIPPDRLSSKSNSWTVPYLVSASLPAECTVVQFEIIGHDQGWCSNPEDGRWSWYEVSILTPRADDTTPDLALFSENVCLGPTPEVFEDMFQEHGFEFKRIPIDHREDSRWVTSIPVAKNKIGRMWVHHSVRWELNGSDGNGLLSYLEEGDRLIIWARAQFRGWRNFVKEARIAISSEKIQVPDTPVTITVLGLSDTHCRRVEALWRSSSFEQAEGAAHSEAGPVSTIPSFSRGALESDMLSLSGTESTPADPDREQMLEDLAESLWQQFQTHGRLVDLDKSIELLQQVLDISQRDDPFHASRLSNLSARLVARYHRTRRLEDVEVAVQHARQSVENAEHSPLCPLYSNELALALRDLYLRTGRDEYLEEAVSLILRVVEFRTQDGPLFGVWLMNAGVMLFTVFMRTRRLEHLDQAIRATLQATCFFPQGSHLLATSLGNIGKGLCDRFTITGRIEDLEESIRLLQQSIDSGPQPTSVSSTWYYLGCSLLLSPKPQCQDQALRSFEQAWSCSTGDDAFIRLSIALKAKRLLKERKKWLEALQFAHRAIDLIPGLNYRSLTHEDQQDVASRFFGLAGDACSLSLQCGQVPFAALQVLEDARGVIMSLLMDDRSDVSALQESYPEQAARYHQLCHAANAPQGAEVEDLNHRRDRLQRRLETIKELNDCIASIRQLPGHERFLLGLTLDNLKTLATEGAIVVVNCTDTRSDAIIISRNMSTVRSVRVPELTVGALVKWKKEQLTTYQNPVERGKKNRRYREFLRWLWSSCVEVIFKELYGDSERPASLDELPRVWWIGVGVAADLPFHAAGIHSPGSTSNTLSWAVSSYIPTLKALAYARLRSTAKVKEPSESLKLLVVTMPQTPGQLDLPGVDDERAAIEKITESKFTLRTLEEPDVRTMRDELPQCDILHFAGHGRADLAIPFNSSLLLTKSDGVTTMMDPLTVRDIFELNLERAKIANLSACSTADVQNISMVDEVIHLASGFQVAGFSHVIASMWQADDKSCGEFARGFYEQLGDTMKSNIDNRAVAVAVHRAMIQTRSTIRTQPLLWAPYIHLGA